MAMEQSRHPLRRRHRNRWDIHDRISAGVLFVALVATTLVLIAVAKDAVHPVAVLPPMLLGFWAIVSIRR